MNPAQHLQEKLDCLKSKIIQLSKEQERLSRPESQSEMEL
jgi:hypothetical protein